MKSQFNRQSKPIPRHHFLILAIIFLSIPITFLVFSCNSAFGGESFATGCRKAGFEKANKGFKSVYKESELHETIELVNVTVHIVGRCIRFTDSGICHPKKRNLDFWHCCQWPNCFESGHSRP